MTAPRRRYPTDLTDAQWQILAPLIPAPKPGGRPAVHQRRELVNAMLYWLRAGCAWRLLPNDLPPWQTADHYLALLAAGGPLGTAGRGAARPRTRPPGPPANAWCGDP